MLEKSFLTHLGARCRRFESCHPDHAKRTAPLGSSFCVLVSQNRIYGILRVKQGTCFGGTTGALQYSHFNEAFHRTYEAHEQSPVHPSSLTKPHILCRQYQFLYNRYTSPSVKKSFFKQFQCQLAIFRLKNEAIYIFRNHTDHRHCIGESIVFPLQTVVFKGQRCFLTRSAPSV